MIMRNGTTSRRGRIIKLTLTLAIIALLTLVLLSGKHNKSKFLLVGVSTFLSEIYVSRSALMWPSRLGIYPNLISMAFLIKDSNIIVGSAKKKTSGK